jgi:opacity protein-like surface antigen
MALSKAGACLAVVLLLTTAGPGSAQSTPQTAPAQPQSQAPPEATPQAGEPDKPSKTPKRPSRRTPRTSRRQPSSTAQGSFEEPRTSRDAGPTRQELMLTANVLGGYDDNLAVGLGSGAGTVPTAMASGSTWNLDGTLSYLRGNALRSLRMDSTGSVIAYPDYMDRPAAGAVANIDGRTTLGRDTTFAASERVGYEPFFNVFSPGASGSSLATGIANAMPAAGLFERRSLSSNSSVSLDHRWSRANSTSLAYSYRTQHFTTEDFGNNRSHEVTAGYRLRLASGVRARIAYRYTNLEYDDYNGTVRPIHEHRIEAGPEIEKALSRRRRFTLSLAAGATRVESVNSITRQPYQDWVPTGSGSLKLDLSPTWSVDGGYRRDFSLLQGVTDEVYTTDTAFLNTGGLITARMDVRVGATYGNWKTFVASGASDKLDVYGASLQLRVMVTRTLAATAGYYYYRQRFSNPDALPAGFPAKYDRNAVRVGLTVWVPLAGTPALQPLNQR